MTIRYTTETGYPDKEDMVVVKDIEFNTENITVNNIYDMPMEAIKGLIGSWIIQCLEEFDNEPVLDEEEFAWFWDDIENKRAFTTFSAEMIEIEDYITVDMDIRIKDNTLIMKLDTWG